MDTDIITSDTHRHVGFLRVPDASPGDNKQFRVVAVRDMPWHNVSAGDVGGFVSSLHTIKDESWVGGRCVVCGNGTVVSGRARVDDDALVADSHVSGSAVVSGSVRVVNGCVVNGCSRVGGEALVVSSRVGDHSRVDGKSFVSASIVSDSAIVCGFAAVVEKSTISGESFATGISVVLSSHVKNGLGLYDGVYMENRFLTHEQMENMNVLDKMLFESQKEAMLEAYQSRRALSRTRHDNG